mgnify:CR=1 FL=1
MWRYLVWLFWPALAFVLALALWQDCLGVQAHLGRWFAQNVFCYPC